MRGKFRIAFLFLDEIHHLYHFIGPAIELSKTEEVRILTFPAKHGFLYETLERLGAKNLVVEQLPTQRFRAITDKLKKRKFPRKGFWVKKNKKHLLKDFDALVFSDYFHRYLLEARREKPLPKLIKTPHGPPGRAYSFRKDVQDFDMNLFFGDFKFEHLKRLNLLTPNYAIVGYPKIDVVPEITKKEFFKNDKPIVLYNPHFTKSLTSWHKTGMQILDFFFNQTEYNLIFAPHLHLFQDQKGGEKISDIPEKYLQSENMYFDFGSQESVNMTYVKKADIYLGDVSSQVYEFLLVQSRPCIFVNAHNIDYKDDLDYRFWKCGDVIEDVEQLPNSLENAKKHFDEKYKYIQEKITSENFRMEKNSTPSESFAKAVIGFLEENI